MKIEILSSEVTEHSGVGKTSGKPFHMRKQKAFAHLEGQKYPIEFVLNVPNDRQPYAPGFYTIDETTFYVDKFRGLALSQEMKLVPAGSTAQLKTA